MSPPLQLAPAVRARRRFGHRFPEGAFRYTTACQCWSEYCLPICGMLITILLIGPYFPSPWVTDTRSRARPQQDSPLYSGLDGDGLVQASDYTDEYKQLIARAEAADAAAMHAALLDDPSADAERATNDETQRRELDPWDAATP